MVCAFFKQGSCGKGAKCKFSHDLTLERKAEKRNMYDDGKDPEEDKEKGKETTIVCLFIKQG